MRMSYQIEKVVPNGPSHTKEFCEVVNLRLNVESFFEGDEGSK